MIAFSVSSNDIHFGWCEGVHVSQPILWMSNKLWVRRYDRRKPFWEASEPPYVLFLKLGSLYRGNRDGRLDPSPISLLYAFFRELWENCIKVVFMSQQELIQLQSVSKRRVCSVETCNMKVSANASQSWSPPKMHIWLTPCRWKETY